MKIDGSTWGFGIFTLFVTFILFLVFLASIQKVDLVTETYYEEELDFKVERTQITRAQESKKSIQVDIADDQLIIRLLSPDNQSASESETIEGVIHFYKPDAKENDFTYRFETKSRIFKFNTTHIASGHYKVKVEWTPLGLPLEEGFAVITQIDIP